MIGGECGVCCGSQDVNLHRIAPAPALLSLRFSKPVLFTTNRGSETICKTLLIEYHMKVSRALISAYLKETEPEAVKARSGCRYKHKHYYAAGVNDVWPMDQHNKWGPRFGLWFHNSLDAFTGYNNWLKVWWTNSNPRLIAKYYIDTCCEMGAIPVTTQSDSGSENLESPMHRLLQGKHLIPHFTTRFNTASCDDLKILLSMGYNQVYIMLMMHLKTLIRANPGTYNTHDFKNIVKFTFLFTQIQMKISWWDFLNFHMTKRSREKPVGFD
ncbi:hypothetical protein BD779DRAFT_1478582 [Infundibulicybe gibba]|nr:hypothetical protein BD779DRAFT_1478582 [Infundibulicybe gibba]